MVNLMKKTLVDFSDQEIEELLPITEKALSQFLHVPHFTLNASGLSSLQAALYSVGVSQNDEVICDAIFPFAIMAILNCGAIPVPVDLDFETLTMSPIALENATKHKSIK
jgi:dTDP-4-amino-4,6-dideoxygalactose transaminase